MTPQQFAVLIPQAKAVLIGESHADPNVEMVLNIVKILEDRGHNLSFFFEHFPGVRSLHQKLSLGEIKPGAFLKTRVKYPSPSASGVTVQTPLEYWGHPEQERKLIKLLKFAQERFIHVKGHDLLQRDFSPGGTKDWMSRRDAFMVHTMLTDIQATRFGTAVAFIGALHVAPQAEMLREHLTKPGAVVTLSPNQDLDDGEIQRLGNSDDYIFKP